MKIIRIAAPLALVALALAGCATATPDAASSSTPTAAAASGACEQVSISVEFGALDAPRLDECAPAGPASDALAAVDITTEGTADYGDQVVCRVDELPAPADETCATLPADAYWALWIKTSPDAEWEYAQEGVGTLQVEDGQSLGLVYTEGTDSVPPTD